MENRNFINGEFINSISNSNIAIEDPSNKKTIEGHLIGELTSNLYF